MKFQCIHIALMFLILPISAICSGAEEFNPADILGQACTKDFIKNYKQKKRDFDDWFKILAVAEKQKWNLNHLSEDNEIKFSERSKIDLPVHSAALSK